MARLTLEKVSKKHPNGAEARRDVTLVVRDDGRGAAAHGDGTGSGIDGMRERATIFGGSLAAAPQTGGGFEVRAVVPLPAWQEDNA